MFLLSGSSGKKYRMQKDNGQDVERVKSIEKVLVAFATFTVVKKKDGDSQNTGILRRPGQEGVGK